MSGDLGIWIVIIARIFSAYVVSEGMPFQCGSTWSALVALEWLRRVAKGFPNIANLTNEFVSFLLMVN